MPGLRDRRIAVWGEWVYQRRYPISLILLFVSAAVCAKAFGLYTGDSGRYLVLARNIADGRGFSASSGAPYEPEVFRPPLYPFFLGAIFWLGLGDHFAVGAQTALYFAAVALAERTFLALTQNRLVSCCLLFLLSIYLPIVRWVAEITTESLCAFLFCLFCYSFVKAVDRPGWTRVLTNAAALSGLFLARQPYVVLLPVAACAAFWLRRGKIGKRYLIAMFLIPLLVLTASCWRNLRVMPNTFQPLGLGSGMSLFVGAVELQETDIVKRNAWIERSSDFRTVHFGSNVTAMVAADQNLRRAALAVIRERQPAYLRRVAYVTFFRQWVESFDPKVSGPPAALVALPSSILLAFAYAGLVLRWPHSRFDFVLALFCFSVSFAHAVFVNEARYTAPLRPILYGFACVAAARWVGVPAHDPGEVRK